MEKPEVASAKQNFLHKTILPSCVISTQLLHMMFKDSAPQTVLHGPAASILPKNLLEM